MIMLLLLYHHTELPVFLTPYILFSLQITTFIYSKINLWAICELMHSWVWVEKHGFHEWSPYAPYRRLS